MTIWKHEQSDGSGNWFLHLIAKLFNIQCGSCVKEWQQGPLRCTLRCWHAPKHHDAVLGIRWCYGDEFFEG